MSSPEPSPSSVSDVAERTSRDEPPVLPLAFGRYVLFDRIGRGGMADIFLARADMAGIGSRLCVLKQILPSLSHDPQFERMLIAEAKLAAHLTHSNIVQVFDLGREDDRLFIVMEYVEGFDLNQLLRALSRERLALPAEFAILIVREMLRGLDYAHRLRDADERPLGLVHRDVSPSNVLISFEGEVKLCDFGIARALSTHAEAGAPDQIPAQARIVGKSAYMSPEQARGDELDARADVFVAGIVLWELCAGRRLYRGTESEMLAQARRGVVPPLEDRGLPAQKRLQSVLDRALAISRDARFGSAQAFLAALEDYAIEARLMASQLKLGSFLSEHFEEQMLDLRRQRELAVRALAAVDVEAGAEAGGEPAQGIATTGVIPAREARWREPGMREDFPPSRELSLDSAMIALPGEDAPHDLSDQELENTLIGLDVLAKESLAEAMARRELMRPYAGLRAPDVALGPLSTSLVLPPEEEGPRELTWYALAMGILLMGVVGYWLS